MLMTEAIFGGDNPWYLTLYSEVGCLIKKAMSAYFEIETAMAACKYF